ncbi:MAG TPA: hypothetical protein VFQ05_08565 [Candidatus Eisenbacteria bacterium]|nr:hypothetical protein [Candidatus Eisenbacteria bacterium]
MSKPPIIIVLLALLTTAFVGPAHAGLVWGGGGNAPAPPSLVWGGNRAPAAPSTGIIRRAFEARASYTFPTTFPSPVNRYDWSRWLGWIIGED